MYNSSSNKNINNTGTELLNGSVNDVAMLNKDDNNSSCQSSESDYDDDEIEAISLHILNEKDGVANATATTTQASTSATYRARPVTPTPRRRASFTEKKPKNLHLKIPAERGDTTTTPGTSTGTGNVVQAPLAETENVRLSSQVEESASIATTTTTTTNTIFPHEHHKTLKRLDIGFEHITFTPKAGLCTRANKIILDGVYGEFRNGELSAIVGPSGAGKSTFLNILSGYTAYGYDGDITVNGHVRDIKVFKQNVAFIRQDTSLQPFLTVKEAMHFAANLKIGSHMTPTERRERVRKILEAMGMYDNRYTRTGNLSGGQLKRLAIALELVNNPPVLILDEPTSGLDSSTSNQCISLLKKLAMEGRTVICTIHQPSALSFEMFDHLYAIARGQCIYAGATQNLVPFLAEMQLHCPESYNPADYLMEIATDDYGHQNPKLVEKLQNGRNHEYRYAQTAYHAQVEAMRKVDKMMSTGLVTPVAAPLLTPLPSSASSNDRKPYYPSSYHQHQQHLHQTSSSASASATSHHHHHHHHHQQHLHYQHQHSSHSQHTKPLTPINEMSSRVWDSRGNMLSGNGAASDAMTAAVEQRKSTTAPRKQSASQAADQTRKLCKRENIYATPFYKQLSILLLRTFLILWRDSSLTTMRFVIHFGAALLIGFLYYGIGNDAGNALNNFRYVFYTIMFIMYCAFSAILVKFPLEFPIVSREHFNRWYSLRAYYIAITLADIPIQTISTGLFVCTTYLMTGQPLEWFRFLLYFFIVLLSALVGQSIGLAVGASLSVQLGAILGPFFICPFLAFSGFFLQEKDALPPLRWIFHTSFLKYSLDGGMLSLFGYDRPKLECYELYCHFQRPNLLLKYLDMSNANYEWAMVFLVCAFIGLRILSFYIMSFRLRLFR